MPAFRSKTQEISENYCSACCGHLLSILFLKVKCAGYIHHWINKDDLSPSANSYMIDTGTLTLLKEGEGHPRMSTEEAKSQHKNAHIIHRNSKGSDRDYSLNHPHLTLPNMLVSIWRTLITCSWTLCMQIPWREQMPMLWWRQVQNTDWQVTYSHTRKCPL